LTVLVPHDQIESAFQIVQVHLNLPPYLMPMNDIGTTMMSDYSGLPV